MLIELRLYTYPAFQHIFPEFVGNVNNGDGLHSSIRLCVTISRKLLYYGIREQVTHHASHMINRSSVSFASVPYSATATTLD